MNIRRKVFACAEDSEGNESYYSVNDTYAYNEERVYSVPMTEEEYALFSEYCADRYFGTIAANGVNYSPKAILDIARATGKSKEKVREEVIRGINPMDPNSKEKLSGVKKILKDTTPKSKAGKKGFWSTEDNSSLSVGRGKGSYDRAIAEQKARGEKIEGQGAKSLKDGRAGYIPTNNKTAYQYEVTKGELEDAFNNGPSLTTRAKILGNNVMRHVKNHKLAYGLGAGALGLAGAGYLAKKAYDKRKKEQEEEEENGED